MTVKASYNCPEAEYSRLLDEYMLCSSGFGADGVEDFDETDISW